MLATAVGAGNRTLRAYLSTQASGGAAAVNARDRIGSGPWQNAKGVVIAANVDELHGNNNLTKPSSLITHHACSRARRRPGALPVANLRAAVERGDHRQQPEFHRRAAFRR